MSGNTTPTQLDALVAITNRKIARNILTTNYEVLSVAPYSSAVSPHNTVVEVRVDTLANSPLIAIPEHDRYVKRKVHLTRIDLKDIAEFRGIPKNELGQYEFEDTTVESVILELDANIVEDELEVIVVDEDTGLTVVRAKADSLGYVGSLSVVAAGEPVDNRVFVTAANHPKLTVYGAIDPTTGGVGTPLSALAVGQQAYLVYSADNLTSDIYCYLRAYGGVVNTIDPTFAILDTVGPSQPTFKFFTVTTKQGSAVTFEIAGKDKTALGSLTLPVNESAAGILTVDFTLPTTTVMSTSNTSASFDVTPTLTSNISGTVGQKYEWTITSTSNNWAITKVDSGSGPTLTLAPTAPIVKDETVKVRITVDGVQSAEKSMLVGAYLSALAITDPGTLTADGSGNVSATLAYTANPSTTEPKLVAWSITSGTATINATTGALTASLNAGETRTVVVKLDVANRTATRTLTLTRSA